jgi:hypothetical protein
MSVDIHINADAETNGTALRTIPGASSVALRTRMPLPA